MKASSLKVLSLLLLGSACATVTESNVAPPPSSLYSEYKYSDIDKSFYAPFLAATEAHHSERHGTSASYYLQALNIDPDSKFVADRAFFQLLFAGRMDEAAIVAGKINASSGGVDDELVRLVHTLKAFKEGDWAAVHERLNRKMNTGFGYILTPLIEAWTFGAEGNAEGSLVALTRLMSDKRLSVIANEHYAYILDYMGLQDKAFARYQEIISQEPPASLQPMVAYAYLLYRSGDVDGAREFLSEQAERFQNHAFILREGARIMAGSRPTHKANSPAGALSMVFYRLANEFSEGGSDQTAVVYMRIASYLAPEIPDIYFSLGTLLSKMEKTDAAASAYNSVPPSSMLRKAADIRRIEVLKSGGRVHEAEDLVRDALMEEPENFDMLISMADILQRQEKFADSLEFYDKAISKIRKPRETDWYVYFARGVSYERTGNWPLAEKDMLVALKLSNDQPSVLNYLGYSWIDKGENIEKATEMIQKAVEARPDDGFIVDSLGWVYFLTGDYDKAVETLERAVRLEPDDPTISDHLGDAYWRVGRKVEARYQWKHALNGKLKPDERKAIEEKILNGISSLAHNKQG